MIFFSNYAVGASCVYFGTFSRAGHRHIEVSYECNSSTRNAEEKAQANCKKVAVKCEKALRCDKGGYGAIVSTSQGDVAATCAEASKEEAIAKALEKLPQCKAENSNCYIETSWYDFF
jgi:hypothetical protein